MFWFGFADDSGNAAPPEGSGRGTGGGGTNHDEPVVDEQDRDEISDLIMKLMPWGISILLHAGLVLLAFFVVWSVKSQLDEEEVIIPNATLSATPGAPMVQRTTKTKSKSKSKSRSVSKSTAKAQSTLQSSVNTKTTLIGALGASGGKASPFGMGVSANSGFSAKFFGTGGNARKIVYLIDASGSLMDSLPFVIAELKTSIRKLSAKQQFTVLFFQGDDYKEAPPRGYKTANEDNKRKIIEWVDTRAGNIVPRGGTNPVKALERALQYKPQLLFILSDNITGRGKYEVDQRRLLADIEGANKGRTKINTIQFLYADPLTFIGMSATMELIANRTGGQYKYLDEEELGLK